MNDIKTIPFEKLYNDYITSFNSQKEVTLNTVIAIKKRQHRETLDRILAIASSSNGGNSTSEAGSDGVEEAATETYGAFDPDEYTLSSKVIQDLKDKVLDAVHKSFCAENNLFSKLDWFPYQLLAYFGSWKAIKNEAGLYDANLTLQANAVNSESSTYSKQWIYGTIILANGNRSNIFSGTLRGSPQYTSSINPLVPIILAGFKKFQDIPYSHWDKKGLSNIVDDALYQAMIVGEEYSTIVSALSKTELVTLRNIAITDTTGKRANIINNPVTSAKLNHLATTALGSLPKLAKHMAIQTWCAHPTNRTQYMILDPNNWDSMPEPIVETAILNKTDIKEFPADIPW